MFLIKRGSNLDTSCHVSFEHEPFKSSPRGINVSILTVARHGIARHVDRVTRIRSFTVGRVAHFRDCLLVSATTIFVTWTKLVQLTPCHIKFTYMYIVII